MSTRRVCLRDLFDGLQAELVGCAPDDELEALTPDSRRAGAGVGFVAVKGVRGDGHSYIDSAARAGAALVIAQRGSADAPGCPHAWLDDTAAALPVLAANFWAWPARAMTTYGLTGTNGKTTCSHLLASIIAAGGHKYARLGTTGNFIVDEEIKGLFTTPFPIELQGLLGRARERGATHGIMEVSSHALVQGRAKPIEFDAVTMTSFSQDHLDYHADMEDYLQAKLELCRTHLKSAGVALAPVDDNPSATRFLDLARERGARALTLSRGAQPHADYRAEILDSGPDGMRLRVHHPGGALELRSPLIGSFNVDNLMTASALALETGIEADAIVRGLATSMGAPGRLELVSVAGVAGPRVYVDYAHTPDAVERALAVLRPSTAGRLIVLLGCGGDRDRGKRPLMGTAAFEGSDLFWATSDNPRSEDPGAIVDEMIAGLQRGSALRREVDRSTAIAAAIADAHEDDVVLIAGKGHEKTQTIGDQVIDFDDCEHARRALRARQTR